MTQLTTSHRRSRSGPTARSSTRQPTVPNSLPMVQTAGVTVRRIASMSSGRASVVKSRSWPSSPAQGVPDTSADEIEGVTRVGELLAQPVGDRRDPQQLGHRVRLHATQPLCSGHGGRCYPLHRTRPASLLSPANLGCSAVGPITNRPITRARSLQSTW